MASGPVRQKCPECFLRHINKWTALPPENGRHGQAPNEDISARAQGAWQTGLSTPRETKHKTKKGSDKAVNMRQVDVLGMQAVKIIGGIEVDAR